MSQFWAVIHTQAKAEPDVRRGVENIGFGAFLPSYAEYASKRQRLDWRPKSLLAGYVLVALHDGDGGAWRDIDDVDGVHRVLTSADKPSRVHPDEMVRLMIMHASGSENVIQPRASSGRYKRRRRRPRPGRTYRNRTDIGAGDERGYSYAQ